MRRTIALAAGLIAAASLTLAGAATAAPRHHAPVVNDYSGTTWYIENTESGWQDPGIGNPVTSDYACGATCTYWEFTNGVSSGGFEWYLIRINDGSDCAKYDNSTGYVNDEGCDPGDQAEEFRWGGDRVQNLWWANNEGIEGWVYQYADMCSLSASLVMFAGTDPSNCGDTWTLVTPGAAHQGAGHGADGECKDGPATVYCHT